MLNEVTHCSHLRVKYQPKFHDRGTSTSEAWSCEECGAEFYCDQTIGVQLRLKEQAEHIEELEASESFLAWLFDRMNEVARAHGLDQQWHGQMDHGDNRQRVKALLGGMSRRISENYSKAVQAEAANAELRGLLREVRVSEAPTGGGDFEAVLTVQRCGFDWQEARDQALQRAKGEG